MSDALRLVIFDFDGTIVDSHARIAATMKSAIREHGFDAPDDDLLRTSIGLPVVKMYEVLLPHAGPEVWNSLRDYQVEAGRKAREAGAGPEPLFAGAPEALAELDAAGHLLAVTTNKGRPGLDHDLNGHDLVKLFVTTRSAHDGHLKPHPDAVHDILRKTGVDAANCVLVGDTETDILTATNAGVKSIGVAWGYHAPESLTKVGASAIASSFNQVPLLVEELLVSGK